VPEVLRFLVLLSVLGLALAGFRAWERRTFHSSGLVPGVTVVTTPTCVICPETISALQRSDPDTTLTVIDASDAVAQEMNIQAAPTVIVANQRGNEILRRTGRTTVTDAALIVKTARDILGNPGNEPVKGFART